MTPQSIEQRVERLEPRVSVLEQLPARVEELGVQIAQLRGEMHEEFSAIRKELADRPTLSQMREADEETRRLIRESEQETRRLIRGGDDETRRLLRESEEETRRFLENHSEAAAHSILSVHFIKLPDGWFCLDYSADAFEEKAEEVGVEHLYEAYGLAMERAAGKPFGEVNPPVLGHLNLIHKFRGRICPETDPVNWTGILEKAAASGYVLDFNHAGLRKPDYRETYPEPWMAEEAERLGLKLQTGSDAHSPEDVGSGFAKE